MIESNRNTYHIHHTRACRSQGFKDLYGQAFGLYALSYYHRATGDAEVGLM